MIFSNASAIFCGKFQVKTVVLEKPSMNQYSQCKQATSSVWAGFCLETSGSTRRSLRQCSHFNRGIVRRTARNSKREF